MLSLHPRWGAGSSGFAVPMLSPCTPGGGVGSKVLGSPSSPSLASPTAEEVQRRVIEFGGIMDASAAGLRTSDRIRSQPNADVTIMERAMDLAHRRDPNEGNNSNDAFSIIAISDSEIIARAEKMGISLGNSETEIANSVKEIKSNELERAVFILKKNPDQTNVDGDFGPHNLALSKAASLSEDLVDEELLEKKDYNTSAVRRSVRFRRKPKKY